MKLTCVTVTWNAIKAGNCESLIRCVKSVATLKTEHEHLIYDGGSTDGTVELLCELAAKVPLLKVVSEKDSGIYNALNKGVCDARGEWFYVLGADDYLAAPSVLDEALDCDLSGYGVVVAPVVRDGGFAFYQRKKDMRRVLWRVPYSHQGLIMRTAFVRACGGFDEQYRICADWDMMLKAHEQHVGHLYTTNAFAFYASGGASENGDGVAAREVDRVLQKHLGLNDQEFARYRKRRHLPIGTLFRFLTDEDVAFRMSARWMFVNLLKNLFRYPLYPLVLALRWVRRRKEGHV